MHRFPPGSEGHDPHAAPERAKPRVGYVQQMLALAFMAGLLWLLFGQGSPIAGVPATGTGARESRSMKSEEIPRPTVASTSPAITDTLVDLGLIAHMVGRSPYCRSVPKEMPVVGDLRDFDAERLALARPEFLFVQPPLAGVDPALRAFCSERGITLVERRIDSFSETRALVGTIAEVFRTADSVNASLIARRIAEADAVLATVVEAAAASRAGTSGATPDATPDATSGATPDATSGAVPASAGDVLLLVSSEPFLAVGPGNYLDELLAANGLGNALRRAGWKDGWSEISPEGIVTLAPRAILGVVESEAGAARLRDALENLPWSAAAKPPVAVAALPELLSPSLVAARRRAALAELYGQALATKNAPRNKPANAPSNAPSNAPAGAPATSAGDASAPASSREGAR